MERARGMRGLVVGALATTLLVSALPTRSVAQTPSQAEILQRLEQLERSQRELQEQLRGKDAQIDKLQSEVRELKEKQVTGGVPATTATPAEVAAPAPAATPEPAPREIAESPVGELEPDKPSDQPFGYGAERRPTSKIGSYSPGRGFTLAANEWGEVRFGIYTYVRYLNQKGLDDTYVNGLGETVKIDKREDLELNKVKIEFRGWMLDPKFEYVLYTWTNNAAQGQGAQVVVGGNLKYVFDKSLMVGAGILSLPTTRSTSGNFPYWLTVDHRTIADEFFRGSYSSGFFAMGNPLPGVAYYTMLANNLSILGVDAGQLDEDFTTTSTAVWWMPTTGEFGPRSGFGDYEEHEDVATRLGVHFTFSPEDRQSQPNTEDIDNTQIRLSNGTIIFTPGALAPGVAVSNVDYYMTAFDAGLKYRGFALEGEYYLRWLNDFKADGPLPIDHTFDQGFQVLASAMAVPKTLQLYTTGSAVFGEFGEPWEIAAGANWWLFQRREVRLNLEYIYDYKSPIGYTAVPQVVGGTGSIFNANLELSF